MAIADYELVACFVSGGHVQLEAVVGFSLESVEEQLEGSFSKDFLQLITADFTCCLFVGEGENVRVSGCHSDI